MLSGVEIEFSKEELRGLVKALRVADWVSKSKDPQTPIEAVDMLALQQKVYKAAADAGMKDVVCYNFGACKYEEHPDFDLHIFEDLLDAYDEDVFWNGLVDRLVVRALEERHGEAVRQMIEDNPDYRMEEREVLAERLRTVMAKDGIYALHLEPGWAVPDGLFDDPEGDSFDPKLN